MISLLSIGNGFRALAMGAFLLLLAQGCSKRADDCSAPQAPPPTDASSKMFSDGVVAPAEVKHEAAPKSNRTPEITGDDTNGDGISDDGDDEADGEGNKKSRPIH